MMLSRFDPSSAASSIIFVDGSSRCITGTGTVHSKSSVSLSNDHHIHGVPFNRLCVSHLIKSLNCLVTFSPTSCVFQNL